MAKKKLSMECFTKKVSYIYCRSSISNKLVWSLQARVSKVVKNSQYFPSTTAGVWHHKEGLGRWNNISIRVWWRLCWSLIIILIVKVFTYNLYLILDLYLIINLYIMLFC